MSLSSSASYLGKSASVHGYDYTPPLPGSSKTKNPLACLIVKIGKAIAGAFRAIGRFFKRLFGIGKEKNLTLKDHEVAMIQSANRFGSSPKPKPRSSDLKDKAVSQLDALLDPEYSPTKRLEDKIDKYGLAGLDLAKTSAAPKAVKKPKPTLPPIKDPVMREFHDTAQQFMEAALNCVFDKKVAPALDNVGKGLGQMSEGLKFGVDLAVKMGDKASKPLFEKLKKFSLKEKLQPDFENMIKWLLKGDVKKDFKEKLMQALKNDYPDQEELETIVDPCLAWLLKSNKSQPLSKAYEGAGISLEGNEKTIDKVFETALLLLFDQKISQIMQSFQDKLDGKLSDILRKAVLENGKKMTGILMRRMIEVLENTEYSKTFDSLVGLGLDQTKAIVAVEKAKEQEIARQKSLIAKAKKAKTSTGSNPKENEVKFELLRHLQKVQKVGEEKWIAMCAEKEGRKAYAEQLLCHPKVAELMLNPGMKAVEMEAAKKALFKDLADQILPVLLPKQKVQLPSGEVKELDGLVYLLSQVEIAPEFKELYQEMGDIAKEVLTTETQQMIKDTYEKVWSLCGDHVEKMVVFEAEKILKQFISKSVGTLFSKFITPSFINEKVGAHILPAIQKELLAALGKQLISVNQSQFVPLFSELIAAEGPEREKAIGKISQKAHELTAKAVTQYSEEFIGISNKEFRELILPEIESIESGIRAYQAAKDTDSSSSVKVALQGYFKDVNHGVNPHYGEIVENLVFKLGKFNSTAEFFFDWVKKMISEQVTASVHEVQASPHFVVGKATAQIKKKLLDKEAIEELIFGDKEVVSDEDAQATLQAEISKVSKVAHDLIMKKVSDTSGAWYKKPIVKKVIGSDHARLESLIGDVYQKVFGDKHFTQNAVVRAQEIVMDALVAGSSKMEASGLPKPIKAEKMPSVKDLFA